MCQAEEELKSVNSPVQDEKEVKTQKAASKAKETKPNNLTQNIHNVAPPVYNTVDESELDWDNDIPFAPIGLQYPQLLWVM